MGVKLQAINCAVAGRHYACLMWKGMAPPVELVVPHEHDAIMHMLISDRQ